MTEEIVFSESVGRGQFFTCKCKKKLRNDIKIVCEVLIATKLSFWKTSKELTETFENARFCDFQTCSFYNPFLCESVLAISREMISCLLWSSFN